MMQHRETKKGNMNEEKRRGEQIKNVNKHLIKVPKGEEKGWGRDNI